MVIAVAVAFASQSVDAGSDPFMRASWHFWIALARSMTYFADAFVIARAHGESAAYADEASTTRTKGRTTSRFILHRYGTLQCGQHPQITGTPGLFPGNDARAPAIGARIPLLPAVGRDD